MFFCPVCGLFYRESYNVDFFKRLASFYWTGLISCSSFWCSNFLINYSTLIPWLKRSLGFQQHHHQNSQVNQEINTVNSFPTVDIRFWPTFRLCCLVKQSTACNWQILTKQIFSILNLLIFCSGDDFGTRFVVFVTLYRVMFSWSSISESF